MRKRFGHEIEGEDADIEWVPFSEHEATIKEKDDELETLDAKLAVCEEKLKERDIELKDQQITIEEKDKREKAYRVMLEDTGLYGIVEGDDIEERLQVVMKELEEESE